MIRLATAGSQSAKDTLVESNMRLVVSIAKSYVTPGLPLEDLVQEGAMGLMTAVERFDVTQGVRFSTYATHWVRQALGRAVDNKGRMIRLPAHMNDAIRLVSKSRSEYLHAIGSEPSDEALAAWMGTTLKKLKKILSVVVEPMSLDAGVGDDASTPLGALIEDDGAGNPLTRIIDDVTRDEVSKALGTLNQAERKILDLKLDHEGQAQITKVCSEQGISRERAKSLEQTGIRKLAEAARSRKLEL